MGLLYNINNICSKILKESKLVFIKLNILNYISIIICFFFALWFIYIFLMNYKFFFLYNKLNNLFKLLFLCLSSEKFILEYKVHIFTFFLWFYIYIIKQFMIIKKNLFYLLLLLLIFLFIFYFKKYIDIFLIILFIIFYIYLLLNL